MPCRTSTRGICLRDWRGRRRGSTSGRRLAPRRSSSQRSSHRRQSPRGRSDHPLAGSLRESPRGQPRRDLRSPAHKYAKRMARVREMRGGASLRAGEYTGASRHQDSRPPATFSPLDTPVTERLDVIAQPLLPLLKSLPDNAVNGHARADAIAHAAPLGDNRAVLAAWYMVGQERHTLRDSCQEYRS